MCPGQRDSFSLYFACSYYITESNINSICGSLKCVLHLTLIEIALGITADNGAGKGKTVLQMTIPFCLYVLGLEHKVLFCRMG